MNAIKNSWFIIGLISRVALIGIFADSLILHPPASKTDFSGSWGLLMGIIFVIAAITGWQTQRNWIRGVITGALYLVASVIGFAHMGTLSYLKVWAIASAAVGVYFILTHVIIKVLGKDMVYGEKPKF
jgi:ABC-type multidrug transport system permease subunit